MDSIFHIVMSCIMTCNFLQKYVLKLLSHLIRNAIIDDNKTVIINRIHKCPLKSGRLKIK